MLLEREIEAQIETLCEALIGTKPTSGMQMLDVMAIVIKALEHGLECKQTLDGLGRRQ
jgi:hypothetical protein